MEQPEAQITLEFIDEKGNFMKKVRLNLYKNYAISIEQLKMVFNNQDIIGLSFIDLDDKPTEYKYNK